MADGYQYTLADHFWDLRDDAYDHPANWREVTAEALFQQLAAFIEDAQNRDHPLDWRRDVVDRMIMWRSPNNHE